MVANEDNCINSRLAGYKFIDFTWWDKISLEETKNRVFNEIKKLIGSDFEDKLYKFDKTIHVKNFYQGTLKNIEGISEDMKGKICEIWCEANWNGNTKEWIMLNGNMEIKFHQHVSAGGAYYSGGIYGISSRWVGSHACAQNWRLTMYLYPYCLPFSISSNFVHQYLAIK
ncbi:hypothetical protein ACO3VM_01485 [Methanocaldococcus sp. 10A]